MTLIERLEGRREALTVQEVAELLGVSDKHIYEMTADGTLPSFHIGRSIRLDPQDIADWLRKRKSSASQGSGIKPVDKRRAMGRVTHGPEDSAVYGALRRKRDHLEAAAAIDSPPLKQTSNKPFS